MTWHRVCALDELPVLAVRDGRGVDPELGYVDLVHRKAYRWDGKQEVETAIPAELEAEVALRRDQLLEAASEADDDVLTKYLEGEEITDPELEACLRKGVKESVLAPVLLGSALKGIGLRGLLDAIEDESGPAMADKVLAIDQLANERQDQPTVATVAKAVTLQVTPDQAQKILLAGNIGKLSLVLRQPGVPGLDCPYQNAAVRVCRVGEVE